MSRYLFDEFTIVQNPWHPKETMRIVVWWISGHKGKKFASELEALRFASDLGEVVVKQPFSNSEYRLENGTWFDVSPAFGLISERRRIIKAG